MAVFALQLALNLGWSVIFFALHQIGGALAEMLLLDLAVLATSLLFWRWDRLAALLFLPYLAWLLYATFLGYVFWRLNG
jgi:tryptophan-rich sensory protein